jgi:CheY-like chemotaxis protein
MSVLVVEDEFLIRMILIEDLAEAGFDVKEAANADEAFDLIQTIDPPLQVLVTDVHMPGQRDGLALGAYVRQTLPHVPIIYTTGRPDALQALSQLGEKQFLVRKPYISDDIIMRLRNIYDTFRYGEK